MNQHTPKVSVIIPVYNAEMYLRECLDSIVNQTLQDIEIICVDDGSTDGSLTILQEYEKKDPRVRVLTQPNINAGAARNHGLRYATGDYLSFLDADDFFDLSMLEKAYEQSTEQNSEICVFHCDHYYEGQGTFRRLPSIRENNLPKERPFAAKEVKQDLFNTFVGWTWDKLFLREYVVENRFLFQEQRTTNDLLFTYFALAKAQRITIIKEVLAHHRTYVKTSLEATRAQSWKCFYHGLRALQEALQEAGLYQYFLRDFVNYSVSFSLSNLYALPWPIQEQLYDILKQEWYKKLDVLDHEESFFYNKNEYKVLKSVLEEPYPVFLQRRIAEQECIIAERDQWLIDIKSSRSYRLGRAVTWLPRKLRGGIRCYRGHGLRYTLHRMLYHIGLRKKEEAPMDPES